MNDSRDNYLKAIYDEGEDIIVSNKILAEKLQVAPSSVSEMLSKLSSKGLIEIIPYKGCKLTNEGVDACIDIVRIHRLWEVFLIEYLGYNWREAHEDAHILEHAGTPRMVERLNKFLNYPKTCPHGSRIPQMNHELTNKSVLTKLSDLKTGSIGILTKIEEDGTLLDYLWSLGLKVGKDIKVLSKGIYEGPITILQDDMEYYVTYKAATQIYITMK